MGLDALEMQSLTCPATQSRCLVCWARLGYLKVALEKKTGGLPRSPSLSRCFFCRARLGAVDDDSLCISETNRVISMKFCTYDELITVVTHKINEAIIKCSF